MGSIAKVDPLAYLYIKRSLQMGNPTETIWPSETMPMVSRLLAGGLWNYSFFHLIGITIFLIGLIVNMIPPKKALYLALIMSSQLTKPIGIGYPYPIQENRSKPVLIWLVPLCLPLVVTQSSSQLCIMGS